MKPLNDLVDMLDVCHNKLSFLTDCFAQTHVDETFQFSKDGEQGLFWILRDIEDDIQFVVNEICQIKKEEVRP